MSSIVTASTHGWDTRFGGYEYVSIGYVASNASDASLKLYSRWPCKAEVPGVDFCEMTLVLEIPDNIVEVRITMWNGDKVSRIRAMNVLVDEEFMTMIKSTGRTEDVEP